MSALDRLCLWDFDQYTETLGKKILSAFGRCPLQSMSALERFYFISYERTYEQTYGESVIFHNDYKKSAYRNYRINQ